MFALARMAQRFVISFFVYFVLFCFVLFLLCSNYAKLNKTKKSAIVWHPTKNNRNYNGTVSFVLWCIVEFSVVVVQNETSIMNEKKNKWWLTLTHTRTNTKMWKHILLLMCDVRLFDSPALLVHCFRNLVAPVVWCCFYLLPFMGVISFTISQHRKLSSQRWANGLVNAYVQLSWSNFKHQQQQQQMYQQI